MDNNDLIEMIKKEGLNAPGKKYLIKHLDGDKLSRSEAMGAKCYECLGYLADGKQDCKIPTCPMYDYRPYKDKPSHSARINSNAVEMAVGSVLEG